METTKDDLSLASDIRIQKLIEEAEKELASFQPEIEYLESTTSKLEELKLKKNKLLSMIASLKIIQKQTNFNIKKTADIINTDKNKTLMIFKSDKTDKGITNKNLTLEHNIFVPEFALEQVKQFLRTNNNLNYEIFKSIVFNGGEATTEDIKNYLVKNNIKQPKTGKSFDNIKLKDISSRVNYLVRKNLITTTGTGLFRCILGYTSE